MEKNGKFFIAPPKDGRDFKELFKDLAAAGAGRPLDSDGFPSGPWTPELLAEAISQIDSNHVGVDLRTVQLWFQENDKGVTAFTVCDDHERQEQVWESLDQWSRDVSRIKSALMTDKIAGSDI